jgi:hypothetical protein
MEPGDLWVPEVARAALVARRGDRWAVFGAATEASLRSISTVCTSVLQHFRRVALPGDHL